MDPFRAAGGRIPGEGGGGGGGGGAFDRLLNPPLDIKFQDVFKAISIRLSKLKFDDVQYFDHAGWSTFFLVLQFDDFYDRIILTALYSLYHDAILAIYFFVMQAKICWSTLL